jgi:hypothetical protein
MSNKNELIRSVARRARTIITIGIPALIAAMALLASQLATVEEFLSKILFSKNEIVIRDVTEDGIELMEVMGTPGRGRDRGTMIPTNVSYNYRVTYTIVVEKKSIAKIDNCRGQSSGLSDDTLESAPDSLPIGKYDKEMHYELTLNNRASKAIYLLFRIACDGVITGWTPNKSNHESTRVNERPH